MKNYLIVGGGRLARHLKYLLNASSVSSQGISVSCWQRSEPQAEEKLKSYLSHSSLNAVLLAISDRSILEFYEKHFSQGHPHVKWVHFSGAFYHSKILGCHPLMTFAPEIYQFEVYQKIHWVIDDKSVTLQDVFPQLQNSYGHISPEQKALYHALCVLTGNLPQTLWWESKKIFEELRVPPHALQTYWTQCLKNINSVQDPRTGPLIRGDRTTLEKNINALTVHPYLKKIYEGFLP